jgi:hypothetical protein
VDGLTRKAVELTLAGDVTALRLCLERLVPPCREAPVNLDLPRLETRADAARVLSFLLAEAGRGEVTPGEAEKLAQLVSEHHKAVQLTEIEEKPARPEGSVGAGARLWMRRRHLALQASLNAGFSAARQISTSPKAGCRSVTLKPRTSAKI